MYLKLSKVTDKKCKYIFLHLYVGRVFILTYILSITCGIIIAKLTIELTGNTPLKLCYSKILLELPQLTYKSRYTSPR